MEPGYQKTLVGIFGPEESEHTQEAMETDTAAAVSQQMKSRRKRTMERQDRGVSSH